MYVHTKYSRNWEISNTNEGDTELCHWAALLKIFKGLNALLKGTSCVVVYKVETVSCSDQGFKPGTRLLWGKDLNAACLRFGRVLWKMPE